MSSNEYMRELKEELAFINQTSRVFFKIYRIVATSSSTTKTKGSKVID
jgi:hypothetical protein